MPLQQAKMQEIISPKRTGYALLKMTSRPKPVSRYLMYSATIYRMPARCSTQGAPQMSHLQSHTYRQGPHPGKAFSHGRPAPDTPPLISLGQTLGPPSQLDWGVDPNRYRLRGRLKAAHMAARKPRPLDSTNRVDSRGCQWSQVHSHRVQKYQQAGQYQVHSMGQYWHHKAQAEGLSECVGPVSCTGCERRSTIRNKRLTS